MKLEYRSKKFKIRKNVMKYLKVRGGKRNLVSDAIIGSILTCKVLFISNMDKSVELGTDEIIFKSGDMASIKIPYKYISRIVIDNDDIVVINKVAMTILPKYIFRDKLQRDAFIDILNNNYYRSKKTSEVEKENIEFSEVSKRNTLEKNIGADEVDSIEFIKEEESFAGTIKRYLYLRYKNQQRKRSLSYKASRKFRAIVLITITIVFLVLIKIYNLGGLTDGSSVGLIFKLIIIWILGLVFMFSRPNKKYNKKIYKKFSSSNEMNIKLTFNDEGFKLKENKSVSNILFSQILRVQNNIDFISIIVSSSARTGDIIIPKNIFENSEIGNKIFEKINKSCSNYFSDDLFRRKNNIYKVILIIGVVLIFTISDITGIFIKDVMPSYYNRISKVEVQRVQNDFGHQIARSIKASDLVSNNQDVRYATNSEYNKVNSVNEFNAGLEVLDTNVGTIFTKVSDMFNKNDIEDYIKNHAPMMGTPYNNGNRPYIQTVFEYLQVANSQFLINNMNGAQMNINLAIAYAHLIDNSSPNYKIAMNSVIQAEGGYHMIRNSRHGYSMYRYMNSHLYNNKIQKYLQDNDYLVININGKKEITDKIQFGSIEYDKENNRFYKLVYLGYKGTENYKILKVYRNNIIQTVYISNGRK